MEFEFDKEIDVLLRKARGGEGALAAENPRDAHLDADAVSAFAENALPQGTKQFYTAHLAECARCRKILSNLIAINSEAETLAASAAAAPEVQETVLPWYRRLFVFPQIAYTMGALVVLFSGFLGFLVLQSLTGPQNSEVSFSTNKAAAPQADPNVFSGSEAANANTVSTANTTSNVAKTAPVAANSASNFAATNTAPRNSNAASAAPTPGILSDAERAEKAPENEKNPAQVQPSPDSDQPVAATPAPKEEAPRQTQRVLRSQEDKIAAERQQPKPAAPQDAESARLAKKKNSVPAERRTTGGKTFNNIGGVWFDTEYNKQPQVSVKRGSGEYQKLDAGLRSIAENLGGTVIVLWRGKAYRIQ